MAVYNERDRPREFFITRTWVKMVGFSSSVKLRGGGGEEEEEGKVVG